MKKLKRIILHALGLCTEKEASKLAMDMYKHGRRDEVLSIRKYLDLMNGMDADTWCKASYAYITRVEKNLFSELNEDNNNAAE